MIGVLIKRRNLDTEMDTQEGRQCEDTQVGDSCVSAMTHLQAEGRQGWLVTPEAGRGKEACSPGVTRGSLSLWTP